MKSAESDTEKEMQTDFDTQKKEMAMDEQIYMD